MRYCQQDGCGLHTSDPEAEKCIRCGTPLPLMPTEEEYKAAMREAAHNQNFNLDKFIREWRELRSAVQGDDTAGHLS